MKTLYSIYCINRFDDASELIGLDIPIAMKMDIATILNVKKMFSVFYH